MRHPGRFAAAAVAFVLAGTACGDETLQPGPGQLAVVADATTAAGTARMEASFTSVLPVVGEYSVSMQGVVDFGREAVHITMSSPDVPEFGAMSGETIVVGGTVYMRGDLAEQAGEPLPEGMWLRHEQVAHSALPDPFSAGQPTGMVDALRELGLPVDVVGSERIRDVPTTHYRVDATAEDLMRAQQEAASTDLPPEAMDPMNLSDVETVIDIWVDEQDRLRRMRTETDMTEVYPAMGDEGDLEVRYVMEFELYDYGVDVDITEPPEDQVLDQEPMLVEDSLTEPDLAVPPVIDEEAAIEVEAVWFPEEFPIHPAASVVGSRESAEGHVLELRIATFGDEQLDQVVDFYVTLLDEHGWQIGARSSAATASPAGEESREETLQVAGHGWHGTVTLREVQGGAQVTITVHLSGG
jgi:hypothetical protein